jgi:chemotaxis protein CheZ
MTGLGVDTPELEALFDRVSADCAPARAANDGVDRAADDVMVRIGKMTRTLHDSLRGLGYDKVLASAAESMPDARDRLTYVANMTEKAAERALNAIELAKPIQEKLAAGAAALSSRWDRVLAADPGVEEFKALVAQTREYLRAVPEDTRATNAQLTEVMLAQDFQDLTGQVINRITDVVHALESQLVALLLEKAAPGKREHASGLLNGPVIDGAGRTDVVTGQRQVDDLLESLGF